MATKNPQGNSEVLTPFTYEHFIKAIYSFKNDLLKCYIDEAIGIYCNLRGISVSREKDALKYSDAFEAANYAIFIVSTKIGAYNPEKGIFKTYLNTALSNALKDILKADMKGDFFDQTSKKKNKDDEPETHSRVSVERYWGAGNESESDPDNAEAEKEERIRRHQDDALEVIIKYIDSLPEMNRAAIYASAFGQVLRPDLENYGRDYAEIVAERFGKSAEYIRKIASIGKKEALAKANDNGFNETSFRNLHMDFVQVKPDTSSSDKMLLAINQLKPYQQFMVLQYLEEKIDDIKKNESERIANSENRKVTAGGNKVTHHTTWWGQMARSIYCRWRREDLARIDYSKCTLDIEQEHKLNTVICDRTGCKNFEKCRFILGEYSSILEMLEQMNIEVCIDPDIKYHPIPAELNEAEEYWKAEVERLRDTPVDKSEYQDALQKLENIREEKKNWSLMILRGCYVREEKRIILYPNAMQKEYCGEKMDELLVSTLVHEIMHAYFDRPGHKNLPYLPFIEEPMAEFGMLLYLKETDKLKNFPDGTNEWYDWAYNDVKQKKTCYRFGAYLMDRYLIEGSHSNLRRLLDEYKTYNTKLIPPALMWWE